jgi:DNA-binding transcriptional LysR family regulator
MSINTPDLRQLRYFVAVAERLHFGRAAAALHISQPPLSRSIQDLEQRLGATLLARSRRRVELTPAGARFLEEAKRLLLQLERAVLEVGSMAAGGSGRLRLGFVSLADYGVLPGLLKAYKAAKPGIALALREMLSPEQAAALTAGELDFGLLLPPVAGDLEHIVVQRKRFLAAPRYISSSAARAARGARRARCGSAFVMVLRAAPVPPIDSRHHCSLIARAGCAAHCPGSRFRAQTAPSPCKARAAQRLRWCCTSKITLGRRGAVASRTAAPRTPAARLLLWLAWRRNDRRARIQQHARCLR